MFYGLFYVDVITSPNLDVVCFSVKYTTDIFVGWVSFVYSKESINHASQCVLPLIDKNMLYYKSPTAYKWRMAVDG